MRHLLSVMALVGCFAPAMVAADLPRPAGEFTLGMPGNRTVKISDYKNKVRIVAFILTT